MDECPGAGVVRGSIEQSVAVAPLVSDLVSEIKGIRVGEQQPMRFRRFGRRPNAEAIWAPAEPSSPVFDFEGRIVRRQSFVEPTGCLRIMKVDEPMREFVNHDGVSAIRAPAIHDDARYFVPKIIASIEVTLDTRLGKLAKRNELVERHDFD